MNGQAGGLMTSYFQGKSRWLERRFGRGCCHSPRSTTDSNPAWPKRVSRFVYKVSVPKVPSPEPSPQEKPPSAASRSPPLSYIRGAKFLCPCATTYPILGEAAVQPHPHYPQHSLKWPQWQHIPPPPPCTRCPPQCHRACLRKTRRARAHQNPHSPSRESKATSASSKVSQASRAWS